MDRAPECLVPEFLGYRNVSLVFLPTELLEQRQRDRVDLQRNALNGIHRLNMRPDRAVSQRVGNGLNRLLVSFRYYEIRANPVVVLGVPGGPGSRLLDGRHVERMSEDYRLCEFLKRPPVFI